MIRSPRRPTIAHPRRVRPRIANKMNTEIHATDDHQESPPHEAAASADHRDDLHASSPNLKLIRESKRGSLLPTLATAADAREVVKFLKKRPIGVTMVEAMNADQRRIFEPRK